MIKPFIKSLFRRVGLNVMRSSAFDRMSEYADRFLAHQSTGGDVALLLECPVASTSQLLKWLGSSKSQLRQDLFVLSTLNFQRGGYFVEFGATNGVSLSNTFLLEKEFGWTGILAEPGRCWHEELVVNRRCTIVKDCVWKESGKTLLFAETETQEFSTLTPFQFIDGHADARKDSITYPVQTVSLNELLSRHNAPSVVDYLSIDTEGSELEILQAVDFSKHAFRVITCEHNYTSQRTAIHSLLTKNGYERRLEHLSQFDDWYILPMK
jgi:FkbM family methyltransferase